MDQTQPIAERTTAWRRLAPVSVVILLLVLAAQLLYVARIYSVNWDEAHHLYDGYNILTAGDYRLNAEVPPLLKMAAALPLLPLHPVMPLQGSSQTQGAFLQGRVFLFRNGGDRLLLPARCVCVLFTLLTAGLIYTAGRRIFGAAAGLCGLFLFVFDPNVLAHGALISTDMASALFIFGTIYAFYRYSEAISPPHPGRGWRWLLLTGILAGCAMSAKFTGVLVFPMLVLLAGGEVLRQRSLISLGRSFAALAAIAACATLIVWSLYGFRDAPAATGLQLSPALGPYLASLPHKSDSFLLGLLARVHLFPQAFLWGLANTKHTEWEYTSYFFGRVYRHGPWQYFPAAFVIKSTVPLLILLLLAAWALRGSAFRSQDEVARSHRAATFLLVPVGVYFAVLMTSHFDIGARHLMPVYPFLYVIAGAAAAGIMRRGRAGAVVAGLLLAAQVLTTERVAPGFMAYGNELWGGPLQVRRYLSDANVDWGQQLKTVKQYLDQNHITNCWFAYFPDGAVEPQDYGVPCRRLPTPSGLWWFQLPMTVPPEIDGTVLISESDLEGVESGDGALNPYDAFRQRTPVAILQDGVYVYQGSFAVPLASAWVDIRRSQQLAQQGQRAAALEEAERAAALVPDSTRAQLQLADMLAAQQRWREASEHYQRAQANLTRERPDLQAEELEPGIAAGLRATAAHR